MIMKNVASTVETPKATRTATSIRNTRKSGKGNAPVNGRSLVSKVTITLTQMPYEVAQKVIEAEAENTPRQWSMYPYCGGFIQALRSIGAIDDKTADKLWDEYARGI